MLEKLGKPSASLETDLFLPMGKRDAEALGVPYLPIVGTKHPIAILTEEEIRERARQMVDEVVRVLTTPAEKLETDYTTPPDLVRSSFPA